MIRSRAARTNTRVIKTHPARDESVHRRQPLCHWLFSPLNPDEADWFLARVADGDGLPNNSPGSAVRNRIVKMRVGGQVNETDALALVIYAWNAHRAGETRSKLQMPKGGLTAENFPEPR